MNNIYLINDKKFKSIYISYNFIINLEKEDVSKNAVLVSILQKSSKKYCTQKEIEEYLYSLYGANFDVNIEKIGDAFNIEFRMQCLNKCFLPHKEDVLKNSLKFLNEIIYNPNIKNNLFDKEIVVRQKQYIIEKIQEQKDDKVQFAINRSLELLYPKSPFGSCVYGDENIIKKITSGDLYKQYIKLIKNSCINLILAGNLEGYENIKNDIEEIFKENLSSNLQISDLVTDNLDKNIENRINEVKEFQDTAQSVVTFVMNYNDDENEYLKCLLYNAILGGTPSSKLFQNFREKESLAYSVRSIYYKYKKIFLIFAGIKESDFEKAKEVVINQISDILAGKISDEEFEAAKQSLILDMKNWKDSKKDMVKLELSNIIENKATKISIDTYIDQINSYKKEDIVNIAQKINMKQIYLLGGEKNV